jgi:hypothetical protein
VDVSRVLANRLASESASAEGARRLRLMLDLLWGQREVVPGPAPVAPPGTADALPVRKVGVWSADAAADAAWRRDGPPDEAKLWADCAEIAPARGRKRVVLLGESVARGFFYDPVYTPASALQGMLTADGGDAVQIVDLARTDLRLAPLLTLARASVQLRPDAMIVFAGNNWNPFLGWSGANTFEAADLLRRARSWQAIDAYVGERLRAAVAQFVATLDRLSDEHDLPIVVLLPACNVVDWHADLNGIAPIPCARDYTEWRRLRGLAHAALDVGWWHDAEARARDMQALDAGLGAAPWEIRARAALAQGDVERARNYFDLARDREVCTPGLRVPRCYPLVQRELRARIAGSRLTLVDLPECFAAAYGTTLFDRRVFHDYCHLTASSIGVAMACTAEAMSPLIGGPARGWRQWLDGGDAVPGPAHASASLLAAVHNANWGQPAEIVEHHCREAIARDPSVAEDARTLTEAQVARVPVVLTSAFSRLSDTPGATTYFRVFEQPRRERVLNLVLANAVRRAIPDRLLAEPWDLEQTIVASHAIGAAPVDLLEPAYAASSYVAPEYDWKRRHAFYQATAACSSFHVICAAADAVHLTVTYRAAAALDGAGLNGDGLVTILVNDATVAAWPLTTRWTRQECTVPASVIRRGHNELVVRWQAPAATEWRSLDDLADRIEAGRIPEFFPVYGELYELVARLVQ